MLKDKFIKWLFKIKAHIQNYCPWRLSSSWTLVIGIALTLNFKNICKVKPFSEMPDFLQISATIFIFLGVVLFQLRFISLIFSLIHTLPDMTLKFMQGGPIFKSNRSFFRRENILSISASELLPIYQKNRLYTLFLWITPCLSKSTRTKYAFLALSKISKPHRDLVFVLLCKKGIDWGFEANEVTLESYFLDMSWQTYPKSNFKALSRVLECVASLGGPCPDVSSELKDSWLRGYSYYEKSTFQTTVPYSESSNPLLHKSSIKRL